MSTLVATRSNGPEWCYQPLLLMEVLAYLDSADVETLDGVCVDVQKSVRYLFPLLLRLWSLHRKLNALGSSKWTWNVYWRYCKPGSLRWAYGYVASFSSELLLLLDNDVPAVHIETKTRVCVQNEWLEASVRLSKKCAVRAEWLLDASGAWNETFWKRLEERGAALSPLVHSDHRLEVTLSNLVKMTNAGAVSQTLVVNEFDDAWYASEDLCGCLNEAAWYLLVLRTLSRHDIDVACCLRFVPSSFRYWDKVSLLAHCKTAQGMRWVGLHTAPMLWQDPKALAYLTHKDDGYVEDRVCEWLMCMLHAGHGVPAVNQLVRTETSTAVYTSKPIIQTALYVADISFDKVLLWEVWRQSLLAKVEKACGPGSPDVTHMVVNARNQTHYCRRSLCYSLLCVLLVVALFVLLVLFR